MRVVTLTTGYTAQYKNCIELYCAVYQVIISVELVLKNHLEIVCIWRVSSRAARSHNFVFVGVVGIQRRRAKSQGERISGASWGWRRRWLGAGKCCHLLPVMVLG